MDAAVHELEAAHPDGELCLRPPRTDEAPRYHAGHGCAIEALPGDHEDLTRPPMNGCARHGKQGKQPCRETQASVRRPPLFRRGDYLSPRSRNRHVVPFLVLITRGKRVIFKGLYFSPTTVSAALKGRCSGPTGKISRPYPS
ncbi:MAG: hypothetical protein MZV64_31860 [Ignavibacteriales bacterium]|nr:hypothetical protein [Ignavibacteriales bacterium]